MARHFFAICAERWNGSLAPDIIWSWVTMDCRRHFLVGACLTLTLGCGTPLMRSQSPENEGESTVQTSLVGEYAHPYGTRPIEVSAVGLVTGLDGTGGDPEPSPQRSLLMEEMKARGVKDPNRLLASPTTALVVVQGYLRPGVQKGDTFDIEVRVLGRSSTTSLRGGWLMATKLRQMASIGARIRKGSTWAIAEGPVMVDPAPASEGEEAGVLAARGRVLGGAVALESRQLGLVLRAERRSVQHSAIIGAATNRRFHSYHLGIKEGVANPLNDEFIEITVHPTYKDNVVRYTQVLQSVPMRENSKQRGERLEQLERQLLDPVTSSTAALRLEAIGKEGANILAKGLDSHDPEVRFYSAEALAYLDDTRGVDALAEAARQEPAFRVFALTALSAMDELSAYDALRELLSMRSAETRYGAFRALWAMNPEAPIVEGESLGDQFNYHVLDCEGPPMIHVTRSFRPEIVIFGHQQTLMTPLVLDAGPKILVTSEGGSEVFVSRFALDEPDQKRQVSNRVDDVIRAIVELGGTYPDVVHFLQQAKEKDMLSGRFEVEALPQAGRSYTRNSAGTKSDEALAAEAESGPEAKEEAEFKSANPLPELFLPFTPDQDKAGKDERDPATSSPLEREKPGPLKRIFGKITPGSES
jgi:flagellar basal body P-ring protein FlgI